MGAAEMQATKRRMIRMRGSSAARSLRSPSTFLICCKSRYPIHFFPFLYPDRLAIQMSDRVLTIERVVLNDRFLLHLCNGEFCVRMHISAQLMERISRRSTAKPGTRSITPPVTQPAVA